MKKILTSLIILVTLFAGVSVANAQTVQTTQQLYISALQQVINLLIQEVQQLEQQLAQMNARQDQLQAEISATSTPVLGAGISASTSTQTSTPQIAATSTYVPSQTVTQLEQTAPQVVQSVTTPAPTTIDGLLTASVNPDVTSLNLQPQVQSLVGSFVFTNVSQTDVPIALQTAIIISPFKLNDIVFKQDGQIKNRVGEWPANQALSIDTSVPFTVLHSGSSTVVDIYASFVNVPTSTPIISLVRYQWMGLTRLPDNTWKYNGMNSIAESSLSGQSN